jgi:acyl carrier protein
MDIKAKVRQYIAENILMTGAAADLTDDASLLQRSVLDSTGVLELVTFLEDTFHIKVADEEMLPENLDSLNKIASYVQRKLPAA